MDYIQNKRKIINPFINFAKTKPRLFDLLRSIKRFFETNHGRIYNFLYNFSNEHNNKVTFVQIGANDGLRNDPIREFVVKNEWKGIFIEPLYDVFTLLKYNYSYIKSKNLIFINLAISDRDNEELNFYSIDENYLNGLPLEARLNFLRKSSFKKEHLERFLASNGLSNNLIRQKLVPTITLEKLFEKFFINEKINLLVVDAEGYDAKILKKIPFDKKRPEAILFETHNLGEQKHQLFEVLENENYRIEELDGDAIALDQLE